MSERGESSRCDSDRRNPRFADKPYSLDVGFGFRVSEPRFPKSESRRVRSRSRSDEQKDLRNRIARIVGNRVRVVIIIAVVVRVENGSSLLRSALAQGLLLAECAPVSLSLSLSVFPSSPMRQATGFSGGGNKARTTAATVFVRLFVVCLLCLPFPPPFACSSSARNVAPFLTEFYYRSF